MSLVGSGLTGFALGVWTYQRTGSATQLSLIAICTRLPGLIVSPIAGALVDRWDRRLVMIFSDVGSGISILSMALALIGGHLYLWHICLALSVNSIISAFQWPAYTAATTLLIPKRHFGRASGLVNTAEALSQLISPVLGGVLVIAIGIHGVFLIDFASFIFSVATLTAVKIPSPERSQPISEKPSLLRESAYGWSYLTSRPGLLGLLVFFALTNFFSGFSTVLTTPLVLSFASASVLGAVLSFGGIGFLAGSVLMSAWGGPGAKISGVFVFQILCGFCFILAGYKPSAALIGAGAFLFFFFRPIVGGCSQAIWQSKIAPDVQGRVFAVRRMVAWSTLPLSYVVAGPLADYVFNPLLRPGGALASSAGRLIGVGPGRGIGLLFVLIGAFTLLMVGAGYLNPRLRLLEKELPDAVADAPSI